MFHLQDGHAFQITAVLKWASCVQQLLSKNHKLPHMPHPIGPRSEQEEPSPVRRTDHRSHEPKI